MYQLHTFDIDWRTSPKPGTHFTMVLSFFHDRVGFILNPKRGTFELPGGHVEVWDANWEATSVREYAEEVGVLPVQDIDYAFSVENIDRAEKTSSYCHVFLHKTNVPEGNLQYFQSIPENTSFPREVYEQIILSGRLIHQAIENTGESWDILSPEYSDFGYFSDSEIHYGPCIFGEKNLHLLGDIKGKKILDIGCGLGHNALILAKNGGDVIGIDSSHRQIQQAVELAKKESIGVDFRILDMENIATLNTGSIDIVFSVFALQFVQNIEKLLQSTYKTLVPGGKLIFSLPNPISEFPPSEKSMVMLKDWNGHSKMGMRYFSLEYLMHLLRKCGFVDIEFYLPKYVKEKELTPYYSDYYREKFEKSNHPYTLIFQSKKPYER